MLEDYGAMGRKIDGPPGAVSIEQSAGAPHGSAFAAIAARHCLAGRASARNR
jgi:hypothetical protein